MYMSFTVYLNSRSAYLQNSENNERNFLINWDTFPDSKYIMTCDFVSSVSATSVSFSEPNRSMCIISVDGIPSANYIAGSKSEAQVTGFIGVAHLEIQSSQTTASNSSGILICAPYDNPAIYLPYKPTKNELIVRLFSPDGVTLHERLFALSWILRLHFTPID